MDLAEQVRRVSSAVFWAGASKNSCDERLVIGAGDGSIGMWETTSALHPLLTLRGHQAPVLALTFGPNQSWLVSAAADGSIRIWDARTPQEIFDARMK